MRIETLPDEFIQAQPIIDTIEAAGYEATMLVARSVTRYSGYQFMMLILPPVRTRRR